MVYNGILMKTIRIYVMVYIGLLLFFCFLFLQGVLSCGFRFFGNE